MANWWPIALSSESTVVAEFVRITSEVDLKANLRRQLEVVNKITFSDREWQQFFSEKIAGANDGIVEKTARLQEDHIQVLKRDDGRDLCFAATRQQRPLLS